MLKPGFKLRLFSHKVEGSFYYVALCEVDEKHVLLSYKSYTTIQWNQKRKPFRYN